MNAFLALAILISRRGGRWRRGTFAGGQGATWLARGWDGGGFGRGRVGRVGRDRGLGGGGWRVGRAGLVEGGGGVEGDMEVHSYNLDMDRSDTDGSE